MIRVYLVSGGHDSTAVRVVRRHPGVNPVESALSRARWIFMNSGKTLIPVIILIVGFLTSVASAQTETIDPFFINIAPDIGLGDVPVVRVVWSDIDSNGWPDAVLGKYRVFRSLRASDNPGGRMFAEITGASGLQIVREGEEGEEVRPVNALIFGDVDNDGDQDAWSAVYCDFLKPASDPETGDFMLDDVGNIVYENPDHGWRSEIFINNGLGNFRVLEGSGVDEFPATTCAGTFLDCDKDGYIDLYEGNWYRDYGWSYECYQDRAYRGSGGGYFADATHEWGLTTTAEPGYHNSSKPVYGVTHTDWNNDGWQDILVQVYGRQWNFLWLGGPDGFREVGEETGYDGDEERSGEYPEIVNREMELPFRSNGNTFDCTVADFDNDGDMDCFMGEICHWWAGPSSDRSTFLINQGPDLNWTATRSMMGIERGHESDRWNEGDIHTGSLDYDNDGLLDLLIGSSDYPDGQFLKLYRQLEDHTFVEVTGEAGFDWEGCGGISICDYDRDGDEDILAGQSFMRLPAEHTGDRTRQAALFQNQCDNGNHWIGIFCEGAMLPGSEPGEGANRSAIGARINVKCGETEQLREILGGAGHAGHQNPPEVHFGLGDHEVIDDLVVTWPDAQGGVDVFFDVPVDCFIRISQAGHGYEVVSFE